MGEAGRNADWDRDLILGRTVGNYRVERKLGEGGMGAVYLLRHTRLRNTVAAMKVLRASSERETGRIRMRERFDQEALIADALGSHRVVKPLDVGDMDDGTPYFIMEYVAGRSLEDELGAHGPMPVVTAVHIALRIADTMVIAHEKGIIHRDLKPANIMLASDGERDFLVKLLDFGVARASGAIKLAHTAENMIVGTPGYMSAEAVTGADLDGRADVFSLGVMLFEMLAGRLPFPAPTVHAAFANVLSEKPLSLAAHRPSGLDPVPPDVQAIVNKALQRDAADRCTMAEMGAALADCLKTLQPVGGKKAAAVATLLEHIAVRPDAAPEKGKRPAPEPENSTRATLVSDGAVRDTRLRPRWRSAMPMWLMGLIVGIVGVGVVLAVYFYRADNGGGSPGVAKEAPAAPVEAMPPPPAEKPRAPAAEAIVVTPLKVNAHTDVQSTKTSRREVASPQRSLPKLPKSDGSGRTENHPAPAPDRPVEAADEKNRPTALDIDGARKKEPLKSKNPFLVSPHMESPETNK